MINQVGIGLIQRAPIAVIIPCYKCANTIGKALESIIIQTLRPAEVILVDDASGDNTLAVLNDLADQNGRDWIRVVSQHKNRGPGAARNAGWELTSQPFIAFLDADDIWHPRKIELQYQWMRDHPQVVLSGHGTTLATTDTSACIAPVSLDARRVTAAMMFISNRFPTRTVMLRSDILFRFDPSKKYTEDYLLWLQIILSGAEAWRMDAVLAYALRPEFAPGGYSGKLWVHERRELNALRLIRTKCQVSFTMYLLISGWSLLKYVRRAVLVKYRSTLATGSAWSRLT